MRAVRLCTIGIVVVLALAASVGCVRRRGAGAGRMRLGARQERQLRQQASRELGCPEGGLSVTPLSDRVYQVHGCGQLRDYAAGVGARRGWYPLQPVYLRAAAEMACPLEQLQVAAPTATMRSASGCGRTARYELVCGAIECAWMMTAHEGAWAGEQQVASAGPGGALVGPGPGGLAPGTSAAAAPTGAPSEALSSAAAPAASIDDLTIPEPPAAGSPEATLRAALDARRDVIHRCAGVGAIVIRAGWSAEGAVSIALEPPLSGTLAESCVRGALGAQAVPPGTAGEIVHPVL